MESAQHPQAAAMVGPENRLTVSLLLVWTFAVAVVLVWHQPWVVVRDPHPGPLPGGEGVARLLVATAVGCGVGSVLYWLVPGLRRNAFPCQPGHWLLLAFGFFWIAACWSPAFRRLLAEFFPMPPEGGTPTLAGLVATAAVLTVGSCAGKMLVRWRMGLLMLGAALVWRCHLLVNDLEGARLDWVYHWRERELFLSLNWMSTVLLVILAVADRALNVRRDILHFAGIAVTIALLFAATERYLGFLPWNW
jgi:hypothetical protein